MVDDQLAQLYVDSSSTALWQPLWKILRCVCEALSIHLSVFVLFCYLFVCLHIYENFVYMLDHMLCHCLSVVINCLSELASDGEMAADGFKRNTRTTHSFP